MTRQATRSYRTWTSDSSRWHDYRPRSDDIIIATYPKSGTTWMQRIVSLLIFQDTAPRPIGDISVWLDFRLGEPAAARHAKLESQTHRRFLKSHIPFDGMATFDEVKYIHVARDGRDTCLSYHNHNLSFRAETFAGLDAIGFADHRLQAPYPRPSQDPRVFFSNWLNHGVDDDRDGAPFFSWFGFERTFWEARHEPNVLMVHYADLKTDLAGEMSRIADFLGISVPAELWPELVKAATFSEMKRVGGQLHPVLEHVFEGGAQSFFAKGENARWRGVLADDDLAAFEMKAISMLEPACATWLANGSVIAGRP
jgi:aryl sulfotransferase